MREILFRGKDDFGDWWFGDYVAPCYTDYDTYIQGREMKDEGLHGVIYETVGQFTGMLDKNGTKIFEGDKLHLHYYLQNEQGETFWFDKYVEVKWVQDDVFYGFMGVDGCDYYSLENYSDKEVIGNIHDEGE